MMRRTTDCFVCEFGSALVLAVLLVLAISLIVGVCMSEVVR